MKSQRSFFQTMRAIAVHFREHKRLLTGIWRREWRLATCERCPQYYRGRCLECGCNMRLKTKFAAAQCPLGKW